MEDNALRSIHSTTLTMTSVGCNGFYVIIRIMMPFYNLGFSPSLLYQFLRIVFAFFYTCLAIDSYNFLLFHNSKIEIIRPLHLNGRRQGVWRVHILVGSLKNLQDINANLEGGDISPWWFYGRETLRMPRWSNWFFSFWIGPFQNSSLVND